MAKQHDKQFKLDAVQYYQDHKDLGVRGYAENLGIDRCPAIMEELEKLGLPCGVVGEILPKQEKAVIIQ